MTQNFPAFSATKAQACRHEVKRRLTLADYYAWPTWRIVKNNSTDNIARSTAIIPSATSTYRLLNFSDQTISQASLSLAKPAVMSTVVSLTVVRFILDATRGALCGLDSRTVVGALPSADCTSRYYSAFRQSPSNLLLLYTLRDEDWSLEGETRWSGRVAPGNMVFCRRSMSMLAQRVLWWFVQYSSSSVLLPILRLLLTTFRELKLKGD
ncbi:hypothetical protein C8R45DRAFT_920589 [Mycena sanguinolenta]|nr:hypothetical protein C8R45DRAFT_920589 [Mycena sanguinolenta]